MPKSAGWMSATHKPTMTVPHYITEDKSDMRGIKPGWYTIEDDGNPSCGPLSSLEECATRITQPKSGTEPSRLRQRPR